MDAEGLKEWIGMPMPMETKREGSVRVYRIADNK